MNERSIRCTGEEVRAILAGRQKQLRRPVSLPCKYGSLAREWRAYDPARAEDREWMVLTRANPFGQPGDRLWVRETWARSTCSVFVGRKKISGGCIVYRADGAAREYLCEDNGEGDPCGLGRVVTPSIAPPVWHPSIHMPRWASRLTLEVLSVRVERENAGPWEWVVAFKRIEAKP